MFFCGMVEYMNNPDFLDQVGKESNEDKKTPASLPPALDNERVDNPPAVDSAKTQDEKAHPTILVRKSKFILLFTLLGGGIIAFALIWFLTFVSPALAPVIMFVLFVTALYVLVIFLHWVFEYYVISDEEIFYRTGIFFIRKEMILLKSVENITLRQGFIGNILNYGTLHLSAPTIRKIFILLQVPHPQKHLEFFEAATKKNPGLNPRQIIGNVSP